MESNLKHTLCVEKPWLVALRLVALQFVRQLSHAEIDPHLCFFLAEMNLFFENILNKCTELIKD